MKTMDWIQLIRANVSASANSQPKYLLDEGSL